MRLAENFRVALSRLGHRPVRSFLLLQGTVWGVAVALFPVAVLDGTRLGALEHGAEIGADRISVTPDPTASAARPLTAEDHAAGLEALEAAGIPVIAHAPLRVARAAEAAPGRPQAAVAAPPQGPTARGLSLARGRFANPAAPQPEAVVEGVLARELEAGGVPALGQSVSLPDGSSARVVGVLAERTPKQRSTNDFGFDTEHPLFKGVTGRLLVNLGIPTGDDAWKRSDRCAWVAPKGSQADWLCYRVPSDRMREAVRALEGAMQARSKDVVLFYPPVYPLLVSREADRFRSVAAALFLACLVMGGVVMANAGLLSALRRAGEVAIHRVEGATRRDVAVQWLAEGLLLAAVGGVLGWAAACGLAELRVRLEPLAGMRWVFPWPEALAALGVSLLVGALAQALPAARAAAAHPVEALVDE